MYSGSSSEDECFSEGRGRVGLPLLEGNGVTNKTGTEATGGRSEIEVLARGASQAVRYLALIFEEEKIPAPA
jgi:hypothetical protein